MSRLRIRSLDGPEPLAAKVPEIGVLFWIIKIITTGIGESTSDFLGNLFIPLAAIVGIGGFWYALRRQLRATEYHAPTYWGCVMMVAVFGTMVADGVHDGTGLPYSVTTVLAAIAVGVIFLRWYRSEGTLSIHSIVTRRRETYYWAAVLATFALGTAAGDLTAISMHLGFLTSAFFFAGVIAVPAIAWIGGWLNPIVAFWAAYVVTRPLGASFADWFGKPHAQTGIGLGDGVVSGLGVLAFAALVAYVTVRRNDIQPHAVAREHQLRAARAAAEVQVAES